MSHHSIALLQLDCMIASMEAGSFIPAQLTKLKEIRTLLTTSDTVKETVTTVNSVQPVLRPVVSPLFPVMGSLQSVVDLAYSQLPIKDNNTVLSLLMSYHNTLLQEITRNKQYQD